MTLPSQPKNACLHNNKRWAMRVNVKALQGRFDRGYALDKHSLLSTPRGHDAFGHLQWNTRRSEVGEALYQLKYRSQHQHVMPLAQAVQSHILPLLPDFRLIVPMPASTLRTRQPVVALAHALATLACKPVCRLLSKSVGKYPLKDLSRRADKDAALAGLLKLHRLVAGPGGWNILLLDDLYDSGASLDAATDVLRTYEKIHEIYVATLTWR